MFRFLMGYENLQVVEVTLTVVAPRTGEDLFDLWMLPLFTHVGSDVWSRFLGPVSDVLWIVSWCLGAQRVRAMAARWRRVRLGAF